jgi:hypothetical protein
MGGAWDVTVASYVGPVQDVGVADGRGPTDDVFDDVVDRLYSLDPDEFVSSRDQAAKDLRAGGDASTAKAVKALRRPTVGAWAVNQLGRAHRSQLEDFLEATTAVEDAQRDALAGRDVDLRVVGERRQRLLDDLVTRAAAVIEASGRSPGAHRDDITRTLLASSDGAQAEQLRRGRLVTALEPASALEGLASWFEQSGAMTAAAKRGQRRNLAHAATAAEEALQSADDALAAAEAEVERLQDELRSGKQRVQRARRERAKRAADLDGARRALDDE